MAGRPLSVFAVLLAVGVVSSNARIAPLTQDNSLDKPGSGGGADAGSVAVADESDVSADSEVFPWTSGALRVVRKVYLECRDEDLSPCLKMQMVRAMDRVARSTKTVALAAGVTLERDPDAQMDEKALSKDELESSLPRSLPERERSLDDLLMQRLFNFLQNYSLRFKLPSVTELSTTSEDARRRKGQFGGLMGLGMLLAGSLLPMKFGMLAMLAGKALMLSKLALLISALMAMRNMGGGGGGGGAGSGGSGHH